MKTNQLMTRPMGQFSVIQRTSDGMFNATHLLKQWNDVNISERKLDNYFASEKTQEFINTIISRENLHTPKMVYVKSKARADRGGGTWMHPLLFIDFCMYINPSFKYDVLKFVYDQMIKYRNDAGDAYRELGGAVGKIVSKSFMPAAMSNISKAINFCVFNCHETMLRNKEGEENKMRDLWQLEHKVADLVNEGFIKSYDGIIEYLRRVWRDKFTPKVMQQRLTATI